MARVSKKELLILILELVAGGLNVGLVIMVIELVLRGPKKRLMEKGLLGIILAMALSYLVPIVARRIHSALAPRLGKMAPHRAPKPARARHG